MKSTNKKFLTIMLLAFSMLAFHQNADAQRRKTKRQIAKKRAVNHTVKKRAVRKRVVTKVHAYRFIKRTNVVVVAAHKQIKTNKVYTGDFSKSVHHQRYAKLLLSQNKPHRAIQHSRLARVYALKTIRKNKGTIKKEWNISNEENEMLGDAIANDELDKALKEHEPNAKYNDKKVTDKEMTELEVLETAPEDYKNE